MMNDVVGRFVIKTSPFWADVLNNFKQEMNMFSLRDGSVLAKRNCGSQIGVDAPIVPPVAGVQAPTGLHCGLRITNPEAELAVSNMQNISSLFPGMICKVATDTCMDSLMVFSCVFQQMIVPSTTSMSRGFPG